MAGTYLGDVRAMSFDGVPAGWAPCKGQLLPIAQNTALFSLLHYNFGGGGASFALPTLLPLAAECGALQYCIAIQGNYPARPEPAP